jgi:TRAP transporter TAXI family solute receptor
MIRFSLIFCLVFFTSCTKEIRIYSGDKSGTFFAIATKICDEFNQKSAAQNQRFFCRAKTSKGSLENLLKIKDEPDSFSIIKAPQFYQQTTNIDFDFTKIKIIKKTHDEFLTILVNKNAGIKSLKNLKNKRVNIGYFGSGNRILIENYFKKFSITPAKICDFGATQSFAALKNNEIDAWIYFIGHPNAGYADLLSDHNFKIISLSNHEIKNFQSLAKIFQKTNLDLKKFYKLDEKIRTISSETFLASGVGVEEEVIEMMR